MPRTPYVFHISRRTVVPLLLLVPAGGLLAACGSGTTPGGSGGSGGSGATVTVTATDTACELSSTDLVAGATTFGILNKGSKVTEVYLYAEGDRIVAEKENIGPGTSYDLTAELAAGSYQVACKPGMTGDGIRQDITVTGGSGTAGSATSAAAAPEAAVAVGAYRSWVQEQADAMVAKTTELAAAVKSGDVDRAKELYAPSREPWERIEPVAESFGDIDPKVDLREADLEPGQAWTGWHRLEKVLWTGGDVAAAGPVADQLVADVTDFQGRVAAAQLSVAAIGNGAKELIDEVATGKITGEEDVFSHTDLVDFAANVAGAREAFEVLRPLVNASSPALVDRLDAAFGAVETELAAYAENGSYVSYDTVTQHQRRQLARVIDGLGAPLSELTASAVA